MVTTNGIGGAIGATLNRLVAVQGQTLYGTRPALPWMGDAAHVQLRPYREMYALLKAMYLTNGLYDAHGEVLASQGVWREVLKALRTPAFRAVEFYVARVWPGTLPDALPVTTDVAGAEPSQALVEAIRQVWLWSNWGAKKQVFVRWAAIYGDAFVKVVQRLDGQRVYFQLLDPHHVTDFDTDERDFVTFIRLDIPVSRRNARTGTTETRIVTEVWDKGLGTRRVWEHDRKADEALERLGAPRETTPLAAYGIDFVPVVHCKFRDVGEARGMGAFTHAVDKITEADRITTRLHQMLYRHNKVVWALQSPGGLAGRSDGRPIPPPQIAGLASTSSTSGTVDVGDESFVSVPAPWQVQSLVPQLDYEAALNIIKAHMTELEHDLPELAYARLRDIGGDLSGRSVRLLLSDAIDRVLEVRGNCEDALVRMDQMALTIGKNAGLFTGLEGSFEDGAFEHRFAEREVLPTDGLEDAQAEMAEADADLKKKELGIPLRMILKARGFTETEIREVEQEAERRQQEAMTLAARRPPPGQSADGADEGAEEDADAGQPTR